MDIKSIKQVHDRIREIQKMVSTITHTYANISPSTKIISTTVKNSQKSIPAKQVQKTQKSDQQQTNTNSVKIAEEVIKNILLKRQDNSAHPNLHAYQDMITQALRQYTSNGKLFNISIDE